MEEDENDIRREKARKRRQQMAEEEKEQEQASIFVELKQEEQKEIPQPVEMMEVKETEIKEEKNEQDTYTSRLPSIAPVFIRKTERVTILEASKKMEEEAEALEAAKAKRVEERQKETKELLAQELKRAAEEAAKAKEENGFGEDISSEEEEDENAAEEYQNWKMREFERIRKEREEREQAEKEKESIEKRRQLSDAEILELDAELLKPKPKKQWNYLQKYYHKGAFYRSFDDKDAIGNDSKWDFNQATLEDKIDKSILPNIMQVKNWGKRGRTKWTHLANEDTTDKSHPWSKSKKIGEFPSKKRKID